MDSTQWYVAVGGRTVGPVTTELLRRGLQNGKVPTSALVCPLGEAEWRAVMGVAPFSHEIFGAPAPQPATPPPPVDPFASARAVAPRRSNGGSSPLSSPSGLTLPEGAELRSAPLPAFDLTAPETTSEAEVASTTSTTDVDAAALPAFGEDEDEAAIATPVADDAAIAMPPPAPPLPFPSTDAPAPAGEVPTDPMTPTAPENATEADLPDVDVVFDTFDDETRPRFFDWRQRIVDYFHDVSTLNLPDEALLIGSLPVTSATVLMQEDAMWNLALCLAFGSDALADAVAVAFFAAHQERPEVDGIAWITRTLLSRGFMPSGIPAEAGERGLAALRKRCPSDLRASLEMAVWD